MRKIVESKKIKEVIFFILFQIGMCFITGPILILFGPFENVKSVLISYIEKEDENIISTLSVNKDYELWKKIKLENFEGKMLKVNNLDYKNINVSDKFKIIDNGNPIISNFTYDFNIILSENRYGEIIMIYNDNTILNESSLNKLINYMKKENIINAYIIL